MSQIKEIIQKKQQITYNLEKIIDIGNKDSAGSDDDVQSDANIPEFYIKEQKLKNKAKNKSQSEKGFQ